MRSELSPESGDDWSNVDDYIMPGKTTRLIEEYWANTDPNNPHSVFQIRSFMRTSHDATGRVGYEPPHENRRYTLQYSTNLEHWSDMAGQIDVPGSDHLFLPDDFDGGEAAFFRVKVKP